MKRIVITGITALFLAASAHADDTGSMDEADSTLDLAVVESAVSIEISELSQHGKRFEKAINQTMKLRSRPSWGWESTCDHDTGEVASSMNW